MKKYKAIIFDLDGTLLDTLKDLADSINYALAKHNMPQRTMDEIRSFVGNGVKMLMTRSLIEGQENPVFNDAFADFNAYYPAHCQDTTKPYDGILPLIKKLSQQHYKLAIVSNKRNEEVNVLNKQYFSDTIPLAIGESDTIRRKPAPDMLLHALKLMGIDKKEAVFIGDSEVDIETAKNAEIDFIAVTWGFRSKALLLEKGAKIFIETPNELLSIIE